jgi:hypothetical protein
MKRASKSVAAAAIVGAILLAASAASAQNVKVTPLGSHAGELCARDRATIFEDPTGVRMAGAAYAVKVRVPPPAVIVSHVNEAATSGRKVKPDTRTATFIALVKGRPVHPALSGKTMEFDGSGRCASSC